MQSSLVSRYALVSITFCCPRNKEANGEKVAQYAGPQSIFGYQVCGECTSRVGLSASIGSDCPEGIIDWLKCYAVAVEGLIHKDHATPRAWQLFEADGLRTQVWRTQYADESLYASMLRPAWNSMAPILKQSLAYHIGIHPEQFEMDLLESLKTRTETPVCLWNTKETAAPPCSKLPWLSAETFTGADGPIPRDQLQRLLSVVDIFSPNVVEAESMLGEQDPEQVLSSISRATDTRAQYLALVRPRARLKVTTCPCLTVLALALQYSCGCADDRHSLNLWRENCGHQNGC